jgi:hypothetical protein
MSAQLTRTGNLNPARPGRTAPRASKRGGGGGSGRYPRRKDTVQPVRKVTYSITLHPISQPAPAPP